METTTVQTGQVRQYRKRRVARGENLKSFKKIAKHHAIWWHREDFKQFVRLFCILKIRADSSLGMSYTDFATFLTGVGVRRDDGSIWTGPLLKEYIKENESDKKLLQNPSGIANAKSILDMIFKKMVQMPSKVGFPKHVGKDQRVAYFESVTRKMSPTGEEILEQLEKKSQTSKLTDTEYADLKTASKCTCREDVEFLFRAGRIFQSLPSLGTPPSAPTAQKIIDAVTATAATVVEPPKFQPSLQLKLPLRNLNLMTEVGALGSIKMLPEKEGRERLAQIAHICNMPGDVEIRVLHLQQLFSEIEDKYNDSFLKAE